MNTYVLLKGVLSSPDKGYTLQGILASKSEEVAANVNASGGPPDRRQLYLQCGRLLLLQINEYSCAWTPQNTFDGPPLIVALKNRNPWAMDLVECSKPFSARLYTAPSGKLGRGAPLAINK